MYQQNFKLYLFIYIHKCIYIYIYVYIDRQIDRQIDIQIDRQMYQDIYIYMCIYTYIMIYIYITYLYMYIKKQLYYHHWNKYACAKYKYRTNCNYIQNNQEASKTIFFTAYQFCKEIRLILVISVCSIYTYSLLYICMKYSSYSVYNTAACLFIYYLCQLLVILRMLQ